MVRTGSLVLACLSAFPISGFAQRIDAVKLRQAVRWPAYDSGLQFDFFLNTMTGVARLSPSTPPAEENWEEAIKSFCNDPDRLYFCAAKWRPTHPEQANAIFGRAKQILENRLKENPSEGWTYALRGLVGLALDEPNAKRWIEKGIELTPRDARCWNALGNLECQIATAHLILECRACHFAAAEGEDHEPRLRQAFVQSSAGLERSRKCHERAIELDPKNVQFVCDRFQSTTCKCMNGVFLDCLKRFAKGEIEKEMAFFVKDLEAIAHLCPDEEKLWMGLITIKSLMLPSKDSRDAAPPMKREAITDAMRLFLQRELTVLDRLVAQPDALRGAETAHFLACFYHQWEDWARAAEFIDLALKRHPEHQKAAEVKEMLLIERKEHEAARRLCVRRLEKNRSPRNLFFFAFHFTESDKDAEPLIREALKREPGHLPSLLSMAAFHLRQSSHPVSLDKACAYLDRADAVIKSLQEARVEDTKVRADVDYNKSVTQSLKIYRAVIQAQKGEALRSWVTLREMQREDPKNEELQGLLAAFE